MFFFFYRVCRQHRNRKPFRIIIKLEPPSGKADLKSLISPTDDVGLEPARTSPADIKGFTLTPHPQALFPVNLHNLKYDYTYKPMVLEGVVIIIILSSGISKILVTHSPPMFRLVHTLCGRDVCKFCNTTPVILLHKSISLPQDGAERLGQHTHIHIFIHITTRHNFR